MSILDDIVGAKKDEVAGLRRKYSRSSFGDYGMFHAPTRKFRETLEKVRQQSPPAIIAEIKRSSPSAGTLRTITDPGEFARAYESNGAAALSVLTDSRFFGGSGADLAAVRGRVGLPLLRKDFVIDEFQVLESRSVGADAVLLIASILERGALDDLQAQALDLGMDVLVEVHHESELEKVDLRRASLIGINNRNLSTMTVDTGTTARISKLLPTGIPFVSESGLHSAADVRTALATGAVSVLMGEYFMRNADPASALKGILIELRQD